MEGQSPPGACQSVAEQENGRIPLTDTSTLSAPEGGTMERDDDYKGTGYTGAASDIQRILEKSLKAASARSWSGSELRN